MYRIEKEMLENFYSSKKPLQKGKNIIISDINNKIFSISTITPLKIIKSFLILLYNLYSGFQMAIYCLFLNCITSNKKSLKITSRDFY